MGLVYDEDLTDNAFFQSLRKEYAEIFYKSILEGCVICVPRAGSLPNYSITLDDILGHILLPSQEMPESHFVTLSGKEARISNKTIYVEFDVGCQVTTQVLFEETYYSDDFLKYKVVCLEHPLEPKTENFSDGVVTIATLRDCIDFLVNESRHQTLTEIFDRTVANFLRNKESFQSASLQTLKDLTYGLYVKCLNEALQDRELRAKASSNQHYMKTTRLCVETYIHHAIYKTLFRCICACTAEEDGNLNKTIRNCADLQLQDLDVRAEFYDLVPRAKAELSKLSGYSTVMGKLGCLKKMLGVIAKDPESGGLLAADDLLPIIIFLLVKVNITNWHAHLNYLKHFRFSSNDHNEDAFMVTSLEAALEHIDNGVFLSNNPRWFKSGTKIGYLFEHIAQGDLDGIRNLLECKESLSQLNLCHPLCYCEKCRGVVEVNDPTFHSHDNQGLTPLHVAAMYGQPAVIDYLLSKNVEVDATDLSGRTPLHYASLRGHQSCLLLLIQYGAEVNASDNDLNTPLHLSCSNGHLGCVKALIYLCEHEGIKLLINAQNNEGDTPLHNAARWGYLSVVQILVSYSADPSIANRRKLSCYQVANNKKVSDLLKQSRPRFKCGLNVKSINFDFSEDVSQKNRIMGEIPLTAKMVKKVEKMLRAISHNDVNLACYYLGLNSRENCHPLCSCTKCAKTNFDDRVGVNMCDSEGFTALHMAVLHGLNDLTIMLVKNRALVDVQTRKLVTPLMLACQQQRIQIATVLLESGCSVNLQDFKGNTALHYACLNSNKRLVQTILRYRPRLTVKNNSGRTALQEAENRLALGIVNILREVESSQRND